LWQGQTFKWCVIVLGIFFIMNRFRIKLFIVEVKTSKKICLLRYYTGLNSFKLFKSPLASSTLEKF
jgi:hypothetical protein